MVILGLFKKMCNNECFAVFQNKMTILQGGSFILMTVDDNKHNDL